jgi:anaerobic ribonucleoside-triphosphate reductase activating protein
MRYVDKKICFKEVPKEISLTFTFSGCKLFCKNCHSNYLWDENNGIEFDLIVLEENLKLYKNYITCVLFLGGEWDKNICLYLQYIKSINLKTCLYTGLEFEKVDKEIIKNLDYIKTGPYIEEFGGLSSKTTNQKFIDLKNNKNLTYIFTKENNDKT